MHEHHDGDCRHLFDRISPYLDKELDSPGCEEIARHMGGCEACKRYVDSIRATREALRGMGRVDEVPAPDAEDLLRECLEAVQKSVHAAKPSSP